MASWLMLPAVKQHESSGSGHFVTPFRKFYAAVYWHLSHL